MTNTRRAMTAVCEEFALPRIEIDTAIRSEGDGIEAIEEIARDAHGSGPGMAATAARAWLDTSGAGFRLASVMSLAALA